MGLFHELLPINPATEAFLQADRVTQQSSLTTYFPQFRSPREEVLRLVQAGETSLEEAYPLLI